MFADNFTQYYDDIGAYYPELLRLPELVKISVAYEFLTNMYHANKLKC